MTRPASMAMRIPTSRARGRGPRMATSSPAATGAKLGNYTVTKANGKLSITAAGLTVSADDKSREYGDANPIFTGKVTGLKNGDNITGIYGSSVNAGADVGVYEIVSDVDD